MDPTKPMHPHEATRVLRRIIGTGATIRRSRHLLSRLTDRGIDMGDVLHVLRKGTISDPPEPNPNTGSYTYRVRGRDCEGKDLVVVVVFASASTLILVTVHE